MQSWNLVSKVGNRVESQELRRDETNPSKRPNKRAKTDMANPKQRIDTRSISVLHDNLLPNLLFFTPLIPASTAYTYRLVNRVWHSSILSIDKDPALWMGPGRRLLEEHLDLVSPRSKNSCGSR